MISSYEGKGQGGDACQKGGEMGNGKWEREGEVWMQGGSKKGEDKRRKGGGGGGEAREEREEIETCGQFHEQRQKLRNDHQQGGWE